MKEQLRKQRSIIEKERDKNRTLQSTLDQTPEQNPQSSDQRPYNQTSTINYSLFESSLESDLLDLMTDNTLSMNKPHQDAKRSYKNFQKQTVGSQEPLPERSKKDNRQKNESSQEPKFEYLMDLSQEIKQYSSQEENDSNDEDEYKVKKKIKPSLISGFKKK